MIIVGPWLSAGGAYNPRGTYKGRKGYAERVRKKLEVHQYISPVSDMHQYEEN